MLLALLLAVLPAPGLAWGREGHRIIADLAEAQLTPKARRAVSALLEIDHANRLREIASWADQMKEDRAPGTPSHSIRLALTGPMRADACPSRFCIVAALDRFTAVLADRRQPADRREEALKYVVHLVGDIHQPLHCVAATGSGLKVVFRGEDTNLHALWDSGILAAQGKRAGVERELSTGSSRRRADGDSTAWALESRGIARDTIYAVVPPRSKQPIALPTDYAARMWPVVSDRLELAGSRLASVLNRALG